MPIDINARATAVVRQEKSHGDDYENNDVTVQPTMVVIRPSDVPQDAKVGQNGDSPINRGLRENRGSWKNWGSFKVLIMEEEGEATELKLSLTVEEESEAIELEPSLIVEEEDANMLEPFMRNKGSDEGVQVDGSFACDEAPLGQPSPITNNTTNASASQPLHATFACVETPLAQLIEPQFVGKCGNNAGEVTTNTHSQGIRFLKEVTGRPSQRSPKKRLASSMDPTPTMVNKKLPEAKRKKPAQNAQKMIEIGKCIIQDLHISTK
ncbi:hypothetical protein Sjap_019940 [Stephania japonica]|uniref:Uncharacterized protein n=1 Tax=Stephania japonica TaxID=461633 RepID=A0AAP0F151_9MAGN